MSLMSLIKEQEIEKYAIHMQKRFRGSSCRLNRLPTILYAIQRLLSEKGKHGNIQFSRQNADGRINSSIDEDMVLNVLVDHFGDSRIKRPNSRMWYDFLAYDYTYGYIPINIKTTTTKSADNTGNLAMCVYSYTDEPMDIHKSYENGPMSAILSKKLRAKEYNKNSKRDYYFVVLNKTVPGDVIVNSLKGLTHLTPNINNLPFQINWNKNRVFRYQRVEHAVKMFVNCVKNARPSWRETFVQDMRKLDDDDDHVTR